MRIVESRPLIRKKISVILGVALIFLSINVTVLAQQNNNEKNGKNAIDVEEINVLVENVMKKSKIPGVSMVLINGDQSVYLNYGYSDKEEQVLVTSSTCFELGSMSKAFTALGIMLLVQNGEVSLDDPVSKYLPWFRVNYSGIYNGMKIDNEVEINIRDLLYQTSGIPFKTIGDIPQGNSDDMLENTIQNLVGIELDFMPGDIHQYATINYDVLGLIIQTVTKRSYEEFIQEYVLSPLEMKHTYLYREDAENNEKLSKGYKMNFLSAQEYEAPIYRGNTPAGYIISNAEDMERWMRIQIGNVKIKNDLYQAIKMTHIGDTTVPSQGPYYYGGGWYIHVRGTELYHEGSNPNYSSMIVIKPEQELGICILTNINSNAANYLATNIIKSIEGKSVAKYIIGDYQNLDLYFSILTVVSVILLCIYFVLLLHAIVEIIQKKRIYTKQKGIGIVGSLLAIPLMVFLGFCIYYLPNILLQRLPWHAVNVWLSPMVMSGSVLLFSMLLIFMTYILVTFSFPKEKEKNYLSIILLSLINGVSSALIILTINESFNRNLEYSKELLVYFVFSILFFVYSIKLIQGRLICITNEIAYEKRMYIINSVMSASYQKVEKIGRERIYSGLTNDCFAVAQVPGVIVSFASNLLTLIFCMAFLATKNIYAFLASLVLILINGGIGVITSKISYNYWKKNRDIQDTLVAQMNDLVNGLKELILNKKRRLDFWGDLKEFSRQSMELNKTASVKFLNFNLYNTLMYNIAFGVVVFLFPLWFIDIDVNILRENLFIVFYMIGPFNVVTGAIPNLTQMKVNLNRIDDLIMELEGNIVDPLVLNIPQTSEITVPITIQLQNVIFKYEEIDENEFVLGPLTYSFHTGELVFITGGNGSGKSTLGKIVTGLYEPVEGEILVNGKKIERYGLNELFSSVFSNFNLFKKIYGININEDIDKVKEYLKLMAIEDKVCLNEAGEFDNMNLSTGQKKRLAFVISCMENKPMMIFDEWAAEQDSKFRKYFYETLLPILKEQGKGIIVITHDDRYFELADRVIKMEHGTIMENKL